MANFVEQKNKNIGKENGDNNLIVLDINDSCYLYENFSSKCKCYFHVEFRPLVLKKHIGKSYFDKYKVKQIA